MRPDNKKWLSLQLIYFFLLIFGGAIVQLPMVHAQECYPSLEDWREEDLWTVRMVAHSTTGSRSSAQATWSWKVSFKIGPFETGSYYTHEVVTNSEDGLCIVDAQLLRWRYEAWWWECEYPEPGYWETKWFIKTVYTYSTWYEIGGSDLTTCADDDKTFTHSGYDSIEFDSRYYTNDYHRDNPTPTEQHEGVQVCYWSSFYVDIPVKVKVGGVEGSGTMKLKSRWWSCIKYTYWFDGETCHYIDKLGTGPRKGWAFQRNIPPCWER